MDNITGKVTEHGEYGYGYDDLYRLTSADNPVQADEGFTYDAVGNRLTAADTTGNWTYNSNNELDGYDNVSYDHDDNGNMVQKTDNGIVTNYYYNVEDRLERVEDGSGSLISSYYYDPFGRRLWKEVGGARTYFFYADEGLVGEYDASGVQIKAYGYKPDSTWTTDPMFMKVDGNYYFYQNDHLGAPQKLTSVNGAIVWSAKYSSFGEATIEVETVENNLRFPGQYFDQETGLHYNYFRFYCPAKGTYIRVDPIGFSGGDINLYRYSLNNPFSLRDPKGRSAKACTRRFAFGGPIAYIFPPRHCYLKFSDGSTLSYDNTGVREDPAPNTVFKNCYKIKNAKGKCTCTDECIKKEFQKCGSKKYRPFAHNCCDCVRNTLKACGCKVPLPIVFINVGF